MSWSRSNARIDTALRLLGPGPWRTSALAGLGWSARQVERDVATGRLVRVRRGLVAPAGTPSAWDDVETYRPFIELAGEGAVVSHGSAARIHRMWLPHGDDGRVHLTVLGRPSTDASVRRHRLDLVPDDVVLRYGVPVTGPARTAVDLALGAALPQALVVLDSAVRVLALGAAAFSSSGRALLARAGTSVDAEADVAVAQTVQRSERRAGASSLRRALPHVDPRSESPYESWVRGVLIEAGLRPEQVGFAVLGASGRRYYADLAWSSRGVLLEVDGLAKYGDERAGVRMRLQAERHRQADLEDAGWMVVRCTAGESGAVLVARVRRALAHAA